MNWLQNAQTILALIPALIATIKAVEEAIPGQGQGEAKLAAVRQILEAVDSATKDLWPVVARTITALVKMFNDAGVFAKASP